jgi:hypothetical protein
MAALAAGTLFVLTALPSYVAAMDTVAAQYNVPIIRQYTAIQNIDGWQNHMLGCVVPDAYIRCRQGPNEEAIIAPLIKKVIGG